MKTNKTILVSLCALILSSLGSCKDDALDHFAEEGTEVNFGAALYQASNSRTYYGKEVDNAYPIYWNYDPKHLDSVYVFAPDALAGRNSSFYVVHPKNSEPDNTEAAALIRTGAYGVQWGDRATPFYGFYPGNKQFKISSEGSTITATLPYEQTVTYDKDLDPIDAGTETQGGPTFTAGPDMSCCMMVAKTLPQSPRENLIEMKYTPFATVLDITVNGPGDTNTKNPVYVTRVIVEADKPITGKFKYDFVDGKVTPQPVPEGETDNSRFVVINTMGMNSSGNMTGVPLSVGQTLNLKAFMIPNTDNAITSLKIHVYTSRFEVYTKALKVTNGTGTVSYLQPYQMHKVILPKFKATEAKFNYETWMSQLDPRIFISEISLPGSCHSFLNPKNGYDEEKTKPMVQDASVKEQFAKGIRAFQADIWLKNETSKIDGGNSSIYIAMSYGTTLKLVNKSLYEALVDLRDQMQTLHSTGYCILNVRPLNIPSSKDSEGKPYTLEKLYERFNAVTKRLEEVALLPTDISPNTTLGDVRGKIILQLELQGSSTGDQSSLRELWNILNHSESLYSINLKDMSQDHSVYSPLTFGDPPTGFCSLDGEVGVDAAKTPVYINNPNSMWYMYGETFASRNQIAKDLMVSMANIINETYDQENPVKDVHNKYYMTYAGGIGTNSSAATSGVVATEFAQYWLQNVMPIIKEKKPYGLVYFNRTCGTDKDVTTAIETVIKRNANDDFLLRRKK